MILGLQLGMLIAGLIALVTGRLKLSKRRMVSGVMARLAGLVFTLPLPLSLSVGFVYGMKQGASGRPVDPLQLQQTLLPIEIGIVLGCLAIGLVMAFLSVRRVEPAGTSNAVASDSTEPLDVLPVDEPREARPVGARPPRPVSRRPASTPAPGGLMPLWLVGVQAVMAIFLFLFGGVVGFVAAKLTSSSGEVKEKVTPAQMAESRLSDDLGKALRRAQEAEGAAAQARAEMIRIEGLARQKEAYQGAATEQARREADQARREVEQVRKETAQSQQQAREALEAEKQQREFARYQLHLARAEREWRGDNPQRAGEWLDACRADLRGWEWRYLKRVSGGSQLTIPTDRVEEVALSPDSREIAGFCQSDHEVKVWDARTGRELRRLRHTNQVRGIAYAPDGSWLAVSAAKITAWDRNQDRALFELGQAPWYSGRLVVSPDGKWIASANYEPRGATVKVWEVATRKEAFSWAVSIQGGPDLAFSPDSKRLAYAPTALSSPRDVGEVSLRDLETGNVVLTLHGGLGRLAFNPDGTRLAILGPTGIVQVWDTDNGRQVPPPTRLFNAASLAFSPDGKTLATGGTDKAIRLWEVATGKELRLLHGHRDAVRGVTFSADGRLLASACLSHDPATRQFRSEVKLWPLSGGTEGPSWKEPAGALTRLAFSPDGNRVATVENSNPVASIWDAWTGQKLLTLAGHVGPVTCLAFSPDGKRLATAAQRLPADADQPGELRVWDAQTGQVLLKCDSHLGITEGVAFSPDGKRLATGGHRVGGGVVKKPGEVKLRDAGTGDEVGKFSERHAIHAVTFTPDGEFLYSAGPGDNGRGEVRQWHARSGRSVHSFPLSGDGLSCLAMGADSLRFAAGDRAGDIRMWAWAGGPKGVITLRGHPGGVRGLTISPDGRRLASVGSDAVRLWDLATGDEVLAFPAGGGTFEDVAFSSDGRRLAAVGSDDKNNPKAAGLVKIWEANPTDEPAIHTVPAP